MIAYASIKQALTPVVCQKIAHTLARNPCLERGPSHAGKLVGRNIHIRQDQRQLADWSAFFVDPTKCASTHARCPVDRK